jgi:hypothetical protein
MAVGVGMLTPEKAIDSAPAWIRRQINKDEAFALVREVRSRSITSGVELGVASGYSSAVIFSAMAEKTKRPLLYGFDYSERFYDNKDYGTGQAFREMLGEHSGYKLVTGLTSAELAADALPHRVPFAFIDANHQNPWPVLDLLSLSRFLMPGALVALHDFEMVFHSWGRHASGARDLYRCWRGEKFRYEKSSNLGFIFFDSATMWHAIELCLETDWDTWISAERADRFATIASSICPLEGRKVRDLLERNMRTHKFRSPLPEPTL